MIRIYIMELVYLYIVLQKIHCQQMKIITVMYLVEHVTVMIFICLKSTVILIVDNLAANHCPNSYVREEKETRDFKVF